ncbi:MAG: phosphatase PAP2 family protein [Burkholderiaceae bacterium]|nr:phosphatase PAP2 family protein [Burkholderiaceae bacterium]
MTPTAAGIAQPGACGRAAEPCAHERRRTAGRLASWTALALSGLASVAGLAGLGDRVRELVALLIVTGIVVVVLSGLFPAQSAWAYYGVDLHKAYHLADLNTLRDQTAPVIDVGRQTGIVTFPSYHTAIALILVWVTRGIAPLFWPALILNLGVLVAIPTGGGHYLVDMLAGAAITAAACLWLARRDRAVPPARLR